MKKVLLSSLVAVMAVTSANAKIASTNYADQAASAAQSAAEGYTDTEIGKLDVVNSGTGNHITGVTQTDGKVTVTKGTISYSSLSGLPTVDTSMSGTSTNAVQNKVIKDYVDTQVSTLTGNIGAGYQSLDDKLVSTDTTTKVDDSNKDTLYPTVGRAQAIADKVGQVVTQQTNDKILGLDTVVSGTGKHITDVTQTDGKVTVTKGTISYSDLSNLPTVDTAMDGTSTNAVQNKVIKTYVDTATGSMAFGGPGFQIAKGATNLTEALSAIDGVVAGNQERVTQVLNSPVMSSGITQAKVATYDGYADGKQDALNPKQMAAVDSGIDTEKVAQIATNTDGIAANKAAMATNSQNIAKNTQAIGGITNAKDAEDGNYVLTKKVVDGVATYAWEQIDRDLAN